MTEQTRFETNMQRLDAVRIDQKAALEALGRAPSDVWATYPEELRSVAGSSAGAMQESKTVVPDPAGMEILPDDPYAAMLQVILHGDPNFQPWNIAAGIDIWGKTGKAKPATSTGWPDVPATEEEMDNEVLEDDPDVNTEDKMVLVDNNGNITVGYLYNEPDSGLMVYGGAVFPELPEWDKEAYPYAYIYTYLFNGYTYYRLVVSATAPQFGSDGYCRADDAMRATFYGDVPSEWPSLEIAGGGDSFALNSALSSSPLWSNHDILNADGTVYLKASTPTEYTGFTITHYDPATTDFRAVGWRRVSKHTTGADAGTITKDDFTRTESGGWNYLRNIRSCTREKLYYKGVEVWPTNWPSADKATYPYTLMWVSGEGTPFIAHTNAPFRHTTLSGVVGGFYDNIKFRFVNGVWENLGVSTSVMFAPSQGAVIVWSDHDVLNTDDTVYFPSSI